MFCRQVWARQGLAPNSCCSKIFLLLCKDLALFPKLFYSSGLNFLALTFWTKLQKTPMILKRIFSLEVLSTYLISLKRESRLISPPNYFISIVFHNKPWSRFSCSRLAIQNQSNHLFISSQLNEILHLNDVKLRFPVHFLKVHEIYVNEILR